MTDNMVSKLFLSQPFLAEWFSVNIALTSLLPSINFEASKSAHRSHQKMQSISWLLEQNTVTVRIGIINIGRNSVSGKLSSTLEFLPKNSWTILFLMIRNLGLVIIEMTGISPLNAGNAFNDILFSNLVNPLIYFVVANRCYSNSPTNYRNICYTFW